MSYQHTLIAGNVGREVTSRITNSGKEVANFSVAVNEKMGDDEQTTWFQVTAWEKLAEIATCGGEITHPRRFHTPKCGHFTHLTTI